MEEKTRFEKLVEYVSKILSIPPRQSAMMLYVFNERREGGEEKHNIAKLECEVEKIIEKKFGIPEHGARAIPN